MAGIANQGAARIPRPQGTSPNQTSVQVFASGTMPVASPNGPTQAVSRDQAIEQYVANLLVWTPFLGLRVQVHKTLAATLRAVETSLNYAANQQQHGIVSITGKQGPGSGYHTYGCAIDVNYATSVYVMHEAGERALDSALRPVYDRIAFFVLGRASVIPADITVFNAGAARRDALYNALKEESDAMRKYFGLYMRDAETFLKPYLTSNSGASNARKTAWIGTTAGAVPTLSDTLRQIQADWVTLTGRSDGPVIVPLAAPGRSRAAVDPCDFGMCYPQSVSYPVEAGYRSKPDAPFTNKGTVVRDPSFGFMNFDYDVMKALTDNGLTWGAIGFGAASGDIMHFELSWLGKQIEGDIKSFLAGGQ